MYTRLYYKVKERRWKGKNTTDNTYPEPKTNWPKTSMNLSSSQTKLAPNYENNVPFPINVEESRQGLEQYL